MKRGRAEAETGHRCLPAPVNPGFTPQLEWKCEGTEIASKLTIKTQLLWNSRFCVVAEWPACAEGPFLFSQPFWICPELEKPKAAVT